MLFVDQTSTNETRGPKVSKWAFSVFDTFGFLFLLCNSVQQQKHKLLEDHLMNIHHAKFDSNWLSGFREED
jgi:hypothetical protein